MEAVPWREYSIRSESPTYQILGFYPLLSMIPPFTTPEDISADQGTRDLKSPVRIWSVLVRHLYTVQCT